MSDKAPERVYLLRALLHSDLADRTYPDDVEYRRSDIPCLPPNLMEQLRAFRDGDSADHYDLLRDILDVLEPTP